MSVGVERGSVLIRKILRAARSFTENTGTLPSAVRVHSTDKQSLVDWSRQNLWFIINDDTGEWTIEGIPLKEDRSLPLGEVRIE